MTIEYPYIYVAYQVDKYEKLVMKAKTEKQREVVLERWYLWMERLIKYIN